MTGEGVLWGKKEISIRKEKKNWKIFTLFFTVYSSSDIKSEKNITV